MHLSLVDGQIVAVYAMALFGLAQWEPRSHGGEARTSTEYRSLLWWAIGASLIAANISAEQMGLAFLIALAIAIGASLVRPMPEQSNRIMTNDVSYRTSTAFNIGAIGVLGILCVLYVVWW